MQARHVWTRPDFPLCYRSPSFAHGAYASYRPEYPLKLYETILAYHEGPRTLAVDLGTGHALVARALAPSFTRVLATDPSRGMLAQGRALSKSFVNIDFEAASAETLPLPDGSADMIVAAQAAHWFDQPRWWPEMHRILRPGGTLAVWGYKDPVLIGYPHASRVLMDVAYGKGGEMLGDYWSQPGRSIVQDKLRPIIPPEGQWRDVRREEYEPDAEGPGRGDGTLLLERKLMVRDMMKYVRTWSSVHKWQEAHPGAKTKSDDGSGDVVDFMFEKMRAAEADWQHRLDWKDEEIDLEYGTGFLMARRA